LRKQLILLGLCLTTNDPRRLNEFSAKAREVAKGFSYERFKGRLSEVISSLSPDPSAK